MKDVGRVGCAETGSRASMEPSCTVSTLTGFDPARIIEWADSRYADLKVERRDALAEEDELSAANAVGGMLELLALKSWVATQSTGEPA